MREPNSRRPKNLSRIHELVFSFYLVLLLAWVLNSSDSISVNQLHYRILRYWHPHAIGLSRTDHALFYLEVFLIPAAVIFGCIQLMRFYFPTVHFLRPAGGILAVAGYPLAIEFAGLAGLDCLHLRSPFGTVYQYLRRPELIVAVMCLALWACGKWPKSNRLNLALLLFHFFFWRGYDSHFSRYGAVEDVSFWAYAVVLFPVLGICYALLWAVWFRQPQQTKSDILQ